MKVKHVVLAVAAACLISTQAHAGSGHDHARTVKPDAVQAVQECAPHDTRHEVMAAEVFHRGEGGQVAVLSPEEMRETRGASINTWLMHIKYPGEYGADARWHLWGNPLDQAPIDWSRGPYLIGS